VVTVRDVTLRDFRFVVWIAGSLVASQAWAQSTRPAEGSAEVTPAGLPSAEQLQAEIRQLQERLSTLERLAQQRAAEEEVARTKQAIRQDVQAKEDRSRVTVRYDKGLFIGNADGSFTLRPILGSQFRYVATLGPSSADDDESGFEFRRLRPRLQGTAFSKDFSFDLQLDADRNGGEVTVLDASGQYQFLPAWAVKAGQFKESFAQERNLNAFRQLAVDRSIADAYLGGGQINRVQGVALVYGNGDLPLRSEFTFHDGANTGNTDYRDGNTDYGAGARVEYKFTGDWSQYRDFSARLNKKQLLVAGAAADFSGSGDDNYLRTTYDLQYETAVGWAFFASINANFTDVGQPPASADGDTLRFDSGGLVQASYAIGGKWEVFGRYSLVLFDDKFVTSDDTVQEAVIGFSRFLGPGGEYGHNAKFTLDAVYLPEGAPTSITGLGILASEESEYVLRVQFTLVL
jgi:hypothetical protein